MARLKVSLVQLSRDNLHKRLRKSHHPTYVHDTLRSRNKFQIK